MLRSATTAQADVLRVLADPLRLTIVELLADQQLCTSHLAELTGATQTNLSNHLRLLRQASVVATEPAGRYTYYRLVPDRLDRLASDCAGLADRARAATVVKRPCG